MKNKTKQQYEEWLNTISPAAESEEWIIGGKERTILMYKGKYGTAIRQHDPIGFEVGFKEFLAN